MNGSENCVVTLRPARAFNTSREQAEDRAMRTVLKLLVVLGFGAALAGCVVVPAHPRAYVVAPAPVVVVHPYYYRHYYP
jgi:hypothetical protein